MNEALVRALAREGIPIEQAGRILAAVTEPDAPLDLARWPAERTPGGYTIRAERMRDVLPELLPLHAAHWGETEKYRAGIPLNPDYGAMLERERVGRLLQVNCRAPTGALVGHVRMYVNRSLHTCTLYGDEDTLYLAPAHRGGFVAIRMMRYAQRWLLSLGIREIRANSKLSNEAGVLMRRLGYPAVATQYCRIFSAQEAALLLQGEPAHEPFS